MRSIWPLVIQVFKKVRPTTLQRNLNTKTERSRNDYDDGTPCHISTSILETEKLGTWVELFRKFGTAEGKSFISGEILQLRHDGLLIAFSLES